MLAFHPYADIFPLIEGEAFAELVADVKANDLRERIVVWDDKILDGRNRYRAALAAGLIEDEDGPDRTKYFVRFVPAVDGDPLSFVFSKNFHRRHLTIGQRAYVMAEYETLRHGGVRKGAEEQDANLRLETPDRRGATPQPEPETRASLAEKGQVSERSIASAAVVRDRGVDDLKTAVKQGEIAISAAEQIARLPEPEQPAALAKALPNGARAIMGSRQEPGDSLDYFPTPPWATRALMEAVLPAHGIAMRGGVREPACGEGHIAEVLREYCRDVYASDIFDYGYGDELVDYLKTDLNFSADWVVTNPPFGDAALDFVDLALTQARVGVAMFFRSQWAVEGIERYHRLFSRRPPTVCAFFVERVNLCKGRWDPTGSTATAYCWLVWHRGARPYPTFWIPPGRREALTRPDDAERFTTNPVTKKDHAVVSARAPEPAEILQSTEAPAHSSDESSGVVPQDEAPVIPCEVDDLLLDIPPFLRRSPAEQPA